jgi:transcription termination factor Rho
MADKEAVDTRAQAEGTRENGQGNNGETRKVPRPKHSFGDLRGRGLTELRKTARQLKLPGASTLRKDDLVLAILKAQTENMGFRFGGGTLEVLPEGYGFLRPRGLLPSDHDIYVSASQIRRFGLRNGDLVWGLIRPPKDQEHYEALLRVEVVNFSDPEEARKRPHFERLTPIFPDFRIQLETKKHELTTRLIDLFAPIGKGQRALIVSPPKAGKTTVLKKVANAVTENHPDTILMVLLVDERPEEVTDMERSVDGEVIASTFDRPAEEHMRVANLTLEKAKRLVEVGKDVVLLLDSITRLARASNLVVPPSGRTLSGGMDPSALYFPKRFFGAARNIEEGGSLTIIGTALVDTGSRMDEVIYEEFKGTGNMEVHLSRKLSEQRIFPAIDITRSGTRREELLMGEEELQRVWLLRRRIANVDEAEVLNLILGKLKSTATNTDFLATIKVNQA